MTSMCYRVSYLTTVFVLDYTLRCSLFDLSYSCISTCKLCELKSVVVSADINIYRASQNKSSQIFKSGYLFCHLNFFLKSDYARLWPGNMYYGSYKTSLSKILEEEVYQTVYLCCFWKCSMFLSAKRFSKVSASSLQHSIYQGVDRKVFWNRSKSNCWPRIDRSEHELTETEPEEALKWFGNQF